MWSASGKFFQLFGAKVEASEGQPVMAHDATMDFVLDLGVSSYKLENHVLVEAGEQAGKPAESFILKRADGRQFVEFAQADGGSYRIDGAAETSETAETGPKPNQKAFNLDDFWAEIKDKLEPELAPATPILEPVLEPNMEPSLPPVLPLELEEDVVAAESQPVRNDAVEYSGLGLLQASWSLPNWIWAPGVLLLASGGSGSGGAPSEPAVPPTVSTVEIREAVGVENGYLTQGDTVTLAVTMSEAVNVAGGQPSVSLTIGNTTKQASYASGSGSSILLFTYEIEAELNDADGISIGANALALNGAQITATDGGQAATLTHPSVSDDLNYKVDTVPPSIVSSSASFGSSLNSLEDDSAATWSIVTSGVEDAQMLTVMFGEASYSATVFSNSATLTLPAMDLQAFREGVIAYTVDVSDAAGQAAVQHSNSFLYDASPPVVSSMTSVGTQGAAKITLNISEAMDLAFVPLGSDFAVTVGGQVNAVTGVSVLEETIELTLADGFTPGALVNLVYTPSGAGSSNAVLDLAGNSMTGFTKGVLSDGYIRGAQIYLDANADGIASASEILAGTTTDDAGNFFVSSDANPNNYAIIAVGGVNIDTGVANDIPLSAPAGSLTVNPISTLVQTVMSNGDAADAAQASAIISAALGLAPGTDLTAFDPLSEIATGGAAGAIAAQKAAVQIIMIVALAASDDDADAEVEKSQAILSNIASDMVAAASSQSMIDLSAPDAISSAIGSLAVSDIVRTSISNANVEIRELPEDESILASISSVQSEYLDFIAPNAPQSVEVDTPTNDTTPNVRIYLDVSDATGRAVVAGDSLFLFNNETLLESAVVTSDDVLVGYADITLTARESLSYSLTAYLVDQGQNRSETTSDVTLLYIDTTAPTVQLSSFVDGLTPNASVEMTLTFSEDILGLSIEDIDVGVGEVGELSLATTLANGDVQYTFEYTAPSIDSDTFQIVLEVDSYTDLAGNLGPQSNAIDLKIDSLPVVTITDNTPGIATGTVVYTFNFSEAVTGFTQDDISLSGGTGDIFTVLGPTLYTYSVIATANSTEPILVSLAPDVVTDASGQGNLLTNAAPQSVDTAAPEAPSVNAVAVDDTISGEEEAAGVDITGSAEAGATVRIEFSGEARVLIADAQTGQWSYRLSANDYRLMEEGEETLSVTATDLAGNVSEATLKDIIIDRDSPVFDVGQSYSALDLYGYSADAAPYTVYQASVTALSPVTYSLVANTSPFRVDATSGNVYFAPDAEEAIADSFKGLASYELEESYSLTLRATDLFDKSTDHDFQISMLPRVNALATSRVEQGEFDVVISDTQDGFSVEFLAPYTTQAFQGDVHFYSQAGGDISVTWNPVFGDNINSIDGSSTGIASPQGEDDPFDANMQVGADGEDLVRMGALTWVAENAVVEDDTLFTLHVNETDALFPTWIKLDQIVLQDDIDTQGWFVDLIYGSSAPSEVSGSAASEWFDVMGNVTITSGDGPDVLSYNNFTPSLDVAITDFVSGQDMIDFSPAMNRMGYVSKTDIEDAASDTELRVHVVEASMSDDLLANLAEIFGMETASDTKAALETAVESDGLASNVAAAALLDNALVALFDESTSSLMVFADLEAAPEVTQIATVSWSLGSQIFDPEDVNVFASITL